MTDNDIIKGLKACGYNETCADCPYIDIDRGDCTEEMAKDAFNLINRQKEEIEKLKGIIYYENSPFKKTVRAEAIREFAKFIIDKSKKGVTFNSDIPDYVQEMVGEE